uniref:FHA domain-containing protein n=1 Tax=Steinernema glaseri TaxID=37863 RepID=A0A1I7YYX4_9BILA
MLWRFQSQNGRNQSGDSHLAPSDAIHAVTLGKRGGKNVLTREEALRPSQNETDAETRQSGSLQQRQLTSDSGRPSDKAGHVARRGSSSPPVQRPLCDAQRPSVGPSISRDHVQFRVLFDKRRLRDSRVPGINQMSQSWLRLTTYFILLIIWLRIRYL